MGGNPFFSAFHFRPLSSLPFSLSFAPGGSRTGKEKGGKRERGRRDGGNDGWRNCFWRIGGGGGKREERGGGWMDWDSTNSKIYILGKLIPAVAPRNKDFALFVY